MKLRENVYTSIKQKRYEIFTRFVRAVPDIGCQLYRFQIYFGETTFACDTFISYRLMEEFRMSESDAEQLCLRKLCLALDNNLNEYCSIIIGKNDLDLHH